MLNEVTNVGCWQNKFALTLVFGVKRNTKHILHLNSFSHGQVTLKQIKVICFVYKLPKQYLEKFILLPEARIFSGSQAATGYITTGYNHQHANSTGAKWMSFRHPV
jgi:hypothetical protein